MVPRLTGGKRLLRLLFKAMATSASKYRHCYNILFIMQYSFNFYLHIMYLIHIAWWSGSGVKKKKKKTKNLLPDSFSTQKNLS